MSMQETFDEVIIHMRTMGRRYTRPDSASPFYKTPEGEPGCAIGILIPAAAYHERMECMPADRNPVANCLEKEGHNVSLCRVLQIIHDKVPSDRWEHNLKIVADELGLRYFPPQEGKYKDKQSVEMTRTIKDMFSIYNNNWHIYPGNHLSALDELLIEALKLEAQSEKLRRMAEAWYPLKTNKECVTI